MNSAIKPENYNATPPHPVVVIVPETCAGLRLDQALSQLLPEFSRSRLTRWIRERCVELDGEAALPKAKVWGGEKITVFPASDISATSAAPEAIALDIVHEDADLLIINKPAGLVVHPGSGNWSGTMLNALLAHAPQLAALPRAGIVHRLDKDTSGLLVVAKSLTAQTSLVRQLQARTVSRRYLAVVHGRVVRNGKLDAPIGRHRVQRTRMTVSERGKPAVTHFEILERYAHATLLRCRLETGRTHQIRVHMQTLGHPIVGDPVYGKRRSNTDDIPKFTRQALHAERLEFMHPAQRYGSVMASTTAGRHASAYRSVTQNRRGPNVKIPHDWITPDWPAPTRVRSLITTRHGGASVGSYASFNLGWHCGDDQTTVRANRALLRSLLPQEPKWLHQVHGTQVVDADTTTTVPHADASVARQPGTVCAVMIADCLPVLLCDDDASVVGVAHAGWRGLSAGVIENTITAMNVAPRRLMAYLGPAIGPNAFEVGAEVREAFMAHDSAAAEAFRPAAQKWMADLFALARQRLIRSGVERIFGGGLCTYSDAERFYSYRRDATTGRMAALIWID